MQNIVTIDTKIYIVRGVQVMVDRDLAELYQVETKRINEAVKRNNEKFPADFMFRLTDEETKQLVAKCDRFKSLKHSTSNPNVFTEHGVYMLSTVLKSNVATDVSLAIMRTFVKLKNQSVPYFDIIKRVEKIETSDNETKKLLQKVISAITMMQDIQDEAQETTKKIGFKVG